MTNVSVNDPIIQQEVSDGSVTVPSGEIWQVRLYSDGAIIALNGNYDADDFDHSKEIVLPSGTDIGFNGGDGFISGFDVSNTIDNTPVFELLANTETVTVPTGETWAVHARVTSQGLYFNGSSGRYTDGHYALEGGTTIEAVMGSGEAALITGWDVS